MFWSKDKTNLKYEQMEEICDWVENSLIENKEDWIIENNLFFNKNIPFLQFSNFSTRFCTFLV